MILHHARHMTQTDMKRDLNEKQLACRSEESVSSIVGRRIGQRQIPLHLEAARESKSPPAAWNHHSRSRLAKPLAFSQTGTRATPSQHTCEKPLDV